MVLILKLHVQLNLILLVKILINFHYCLFKFLFHQFFYLHMFTQNFQTQIHIHHLRVNI